MGANENVIQEDFKCNFHFRYLIYSISHISMVQNVYSFDPSKTHGLFGAVIIVKLMCMSQSPVNLTNTKTAKCDAIEITLKRHKSRQLTIKK